MIKKFLNKTIDRFIYGAGMIAAAANIYLSIDREGILVWPFLCGVVSLAVLIYALRQRLKTY